MTQIATNYVPNPNASAQSEKINDIASFFQTYTNNSNTLSVEEKSSLNNAFTQHKNLVVQDNLIETAFGFDAGKSKNRIQTTYDDLYANKKIDSWEHQTLTTLFDMGERSLKQNSVSFSELQNFITTAKSEYQQRGYTPESEFGHVSQAVLSIAEGSGNWWEANSSNVNGGYPVAPTCITDIVGAGLASGWCALGGGSWYAIGWSALGGAIVASSGAVGKIVQYLT